MPITQWITCQNVLFKQLWHNQLVTVRNKCHIRILQGQKPLVHILPWFYCLGRRQEMLTSLCEGTNIQIGKVGMCSQSGKERGSTRGTGFCHPPGHIRVFWCIIWCTTLMKTLFFYFMTLVNLLPKADLIDSSMRTRGLFYVRSAIGPWISQILCKTARGCARKHPPVPPWEETHQKNTHFQRFRPTECKS